MSIVIVRLAPALVLVGTLGLAPSAGAQYAWGAEAGDLSHLQELRSLASLGRLSGLQRLESLRSLETFRGLEGLRALEGLRSLEGAPDGVVFYRSGASPRRVDSGDQVSDSLYREARRLLERGDYRRAAGMFQQVRARDPKAAIAADALYWHAWSMYRAGGTTGLESALASLETLRSEYPRAAVAGDARELRVRVCGTLANQGNERCAREISQAAVAASDAATQDQQSCPREDDDERVAALNALLQMDAERALPLLERILSRRDRCSVVLRRKAVFLVSQKRDPKSADILLNAVRNDPDGEVRSQAVFWLGQLRDERAITILEDILRTEKDEEVLDKAIFALSQQKSPRAATLLRDIALRDNAPTKLREQAIFWIGQQRNSENADLLINLYGRVSNEDLKDKIIFSLSQVRSAATDKWLVDLAMNEREPVETRKKALFWAGQSRSTSVEAITGMYDRITNNEMREQVIFVLSQRSRDAAAIDKLFDIAKNDKDRNLRSKAIFWLGQSRDPRVAKLLEDILNK